VIGEGDKVESKPTTPTSKPDNQKSDAEKMAELLERDRDKTSTGEGQGQPTEPSITGDKLPGASFG